LVPLTGELAERDFCQIESISSGPAAW